MALCLLALAFSLVPSKPTRPSFSAPASSAIFSTSSNSPASVARWSLRKSAMVRKFGALPAASTRNPTSSAKRRSIRRDHIADQVDQMILGQPFTQARRKQKPLFWKVPTVALAHDPLCTTAVPVPPAQSLLSTVGLSQTHLTSPTDYFSDTLLAQ